MDVKRIKLPTYDIFEKALKTLDKKSAKVGWFKNSKYDDERKTQVASVAAQNEFGVPFKAIPPRPFMRPTIQEKKQEWSKIAELGARSVLRGKSTINDVLEKIGLKAAGDIRKKITQIFDPPLSPLTIKARLAKRKNKKITKSLTKPLIDTGIMLNTLTNTVDEE